MMFSYYSLSIRNLLKQKRATLISIAGLTIALIVVLEIAHWSAFELSYDRWNNKADNIYRVSVEESRPNDNFYRHAAYCWQPWLSELQNFHPEIQSFTELRPMLLTSTVRKSNNVFRVNEAFKADSSIFNVFSFDFIEGSAQTALRSKNTVAVSESFAQKLFPGQNAWNKTFDLKPAVSKEFEEYTITAIYKDFPINSHFHPDILTYCNKKPIGRSDVAYIYICLKDGNTIDQIKNGESNFIKVHVPMEEQKTSKLEFTQLTDIHLKSNCEYEIEPNGDIKQVRLFICIGIGILFIALINYINLLIASFEQRNKFFFVCTTMGAHKRQNLLVPFLESLCCVVLVLIISDILFPYLSHFLSFAGLLKSIPVFFSQTTLFVNLLFILLVIVSGILPVILINLKTSSIFSNQSFALSFPKISLINKPLFVLQFVVSIVVLISSLLLYKQNQFLFKQNMGHDNPDIVVLSREFPAEGSQIMLLKEQLLKLPAVNNVSMCMLTPGNQVKGYDGIEYADIPERHKEQTVNILPIDDNFFSFFNIPFIAGNERKYTIGQEQGNYILNEAAVKKLGFESPEKAIGTSFKLRNIGPATIQGGTIIGVVRDFNFSSLYNPIEPTVFFHNPSWQCQLFLKLNGSHRDKDLAQIKQTWEKVFPDYPFEYNYLDDVYNQHYQRNITTSKLINWFTIICLGLSAMGLWGISSILSVQKTKEIGIRKVNGAKVSEVLAMLNKDFVKWVVIAFIIAIPIAWYAMHKWLESFAYKTILSWWIFALAGLLSLGIALLTVSWQSWKTATRNPVEALRHE